MQLSAIQREVLDVEPSRKVLLTHSQEYRCYVDPHILVTRDLDVLKRWIGVPDAMFTGERPCSVPCPDVPRQWAPPGSLDQAQGAQVAEPAPVGAAREAAMRKAAREVEMVRLRPDQMSAIREATRAYLRGPSYAAASYKTMIERFYGQFIVALWSFLRIRVRAGSVLELGPGAHVLLASEIEIEDGGLIRSRGDLTVSCTSLRGARTAIQRIPFDVPVRPIGLRSSRSGGAGE
jgi:hypothetical protein